ncbi:MAG: hypothetical protein A2W92_06865 [Bacteroidetes bacterium GWA2_42_15]|nr:MAG: hypothetical protein A2W92_06865 [Bacteroidetes bacterium GWA2_42_15]
MEKEQIQIEHLLPDYFSGEISKENRLKVDNWRNLSAGNEKLFREMSTVWKSGAILGQMEQFNPKDALLKVDKRLALYNKPSSVWQKLQKIAAVLLIPLLVYSGFLTISQFKESKLASGETTWQEVKTGTGMVSELTLPDGTQVWLNSETTLRYPLNFGKIREVNLTGEACFDVKKDEKHPFVVTTGTINVEVLGTSFNVANYANENQTEVVLLSGKVKLFTGEYGNKKEVGFLSPNQQALFKPSTKELFVNNVSVEKYTAWKDGVLMFADDPMDEVTRKLSRWFNVEFVLESEELRDYVYRATFKDETLPQILDLLKISAPIEYTRIPRETLPDGNYSKEKIIIRKKRM